MQLQREREKGKRREENPGGRQRVVSDRLGLCNAVWNILNG